MRNVITVSSIKSVMEKISSLLMLVITSPIIHLNPNNAPLWVDAYKRLYLTEFQRGYTSFNIIHKLQITLHLVVCCNFFLKMMYSFSIIHFLIIALMGILAHFVWFVHQDLVKQAMVFVMNALQVKLSIFNLPYRSLQFSLLIIKIQQSHWSLKMIIPRSLVVC